MKELELYKFVQDKEIHWRGENNDKLLLWVQDIYPFKFLIVKYLESLEDDRGYENGGQAITMRSNDFVIDLVKVCEHYGVDPANILSKDEDD